VARRVDQVQLVVLAVARRVAHAHGVELDRDPALALEVERVEHLGLHLALLQHARVLDQAVGERRLAVIDVGDDAEVPDMVELQRRVGQGRRPGARLRPRGLDPARTRASRCGGGI
jgi:hypothetical protein